MYLYLFANREKLNLMEFTITAKHSEKRDCLKLLLMYIYTENELCMYVKANN